MRVVEASADPNRRLPDSMRVTAAVDFDEPGPKGFTVEGADMRDLDRYVGLTVDVDPDTQAVGRIDLMFPGVWIGHPEGSSASIGAVLDDDSLVVGRTAHGAVGVSGLLAGQAMTGTYRVDEGRHVLVLETEEVVATYEVRITTDAIGPVDLWISVDVTTGIGTERLQLQMQRDE